MCSLYYWTSLAPRFVKKKVHDPLPIFTSLHCRPTITDAPISTFLRSYFIQSVALDFQVTVLSPITELLWHLAMIKRRSTSLRSFSLASTTRAFNFDLRLTLLHYDIFAQVSTLSHPFFLLPCRHLVTPILSCACALRQ